MRNVFFAVMALGVLASSLPTPAEARDYPFCIKGRDYLSSVGDCSYSTYASCQAAASGRYAYCDRNPFYQGQPVPQRRSRRVYHPYEY